VIFEIVMTLKEGIASYAMSAGIFGPVKTLSVVFGFEVNFKLIWSRENQTAILALGILAMHSESLRGLLRMYFFTGGVGVLLGVRVVG